MDIYNDINDGVSGLKFRSTTKNRSKMGYLVSVSLSGEMRSIFISEGSIFVNHDIPLSFPNAWQIIKQVYTIQTKFVRIFMKITETQTVIKDRILCP